jgi:hypothetical protein
LTGFVMADADSAFCALGEFLSDFKYVTICHRFCSGKLPQAGMPLLIDPVVINQKTSPSDAVCVGPSDNAGIFPVPRPAIP